MNEHYFQLIRNQALDMWVDFRWHELAYEHVAKNNTRQSKYLDWATFASGMMTGASGISENVLQFVDTGIFPILTVISALLTALCVSANQTFHLKDNAKNYLDAMLANSELRRDVELYLSKVAGPGGDTTDETFFAQLKTPRKAAQKLFAPDQQRFSALAKEALDQHFVSTIDYHPPEDEPFPPSAVLAPFPESAEEPLGSNNIHRIVRGQSAT